MRKIRKLQKWMIISVMFILVMAIKMDAFAISTARVIGELKDNKLIMDTDEVLELCNKLIEGSQKAEVDWTNDYITKIKFVDNGTKVNGDLYLVNCDGSSFDMLTLDMTEANADELESYLKPVMIGMTIATMPSDSTSEENNELYNNVTQNIRTTYEYDGVSYLLERTDDVIAFRIWVTDRIDDFDSESANNDKEIIENTQTILNTLGYDCGTPDGISGQATQSSIKKYQRDNGLAITGTVNGDLLKCFDASGAVATDDANASADANTNNSIGVPIDIFTARFNGGAIILNNRPDITGLTTACDLI